MRFIDRLARLFAVDALERQLYPAPSLSFRFRRYEECDRTTLIDLHESNAPGRFPVNHLPTFLSYLDANRAAFFVAEKNDGRVIACCAVSSTGELVHSLGYGLIARDHQGCRIGSTMTLARLAFVARKPGAHVAIIGAVPKSIGFYRRFGFTPQESWLREGGIEYPNAALSYTRGQMIPIRRTLEERGHLIDPSWPVAQDTKRNAIITDLGFGRRQIELRPVDAEVKA